MLHLQPAFSLPTWRITRWLVDAGESCPDDVRAALICNLYGTLPLFAGGALNTLVVASLSVMRVPQTAFLIWLALEIAIFSARLTTLLAARRASVAGRATPTDVYIVLGLAWATNAGYGTYLCLVSGDSTLETMVCLSSAAMAGGICFRNFAAPRLAGLMILLSVGPCIFAGLLTGETLLLVTTLQMPFYLYSMSTAAYRLNTMLVATMCAERENDFRARHDALTGLSNRSGLASAMAERQLDPARPNRPIALLYLDLDGFKAVNDTHGHAVGDTLLQKVTTRLTGLIGPRDVAARIGGDEFVVLTDLAAHPDLAALGKRIVAGISLPYEAEDGGVIVVGVSVGIAVGSRPSDDLDYLLRTADSALYRAKSNGGSRCFFALDRRQADLGTDDVAIVATAA